ncbi:MAG: EI24 domain-containing protein [Enhygromyxa sp.]
MSQTQPPSPFVRGFRIALEGMKLALRSEDVSRIYLRAAAVIFGLSLVIDAGLIGGLFWLTSPAEDAALWLLVAVWIARVIGTLAALLVGPLLAIFTVNIAFPFFNQGVFLAGLRLVDPERAAALEAKPGMPFAPAAGLAAWRLIKFVVLSAGLFVLGLIPVVGSLVAAALQLWLTARTVSWELMDPYFDSLDIRDAEQREIVGRLQKPLLGFGVPVALLLAIPFVGPLCFGLAQAAAGTFVGREFPIHPRETTTPAQA